VPNRGAVQQGWHVVGFAMAVLLCLPPAAAVHAIGEPAELSAASGRVPASAAVGYLEDPDRRLTIEAVTDPARASAFHPAVVSNGEVNFGYSRSAYWLALPIRIAANAPQNWLLEIGYSSLDKVEVFVPQAGGGFSRASAGDVQPFNARPFPHRNLVFPVTVAPGSAPTIYLRVESEGSLTIPVTLWQPQALHQHDQWSYALLSLYYGMLLALLLYNLLLYTVLRDPVFLTYVAFVAAMAVGQASLNGLGNQFLWPDWPAWGNIAVTAGNAATGFFGALFTRQFLGTRQSFPRFDKVILGLAAAFALAAIAPVLVSYQFAAIFITITGLVFALTAVGGGVYCLSRGHAGARYFLLAWTLLLIGVAVLSLRNLGWLPTTALTTYAMQIGSALEMLLLSFALADRINTLRREKEQVSTEALAAREALVENLLRSEQELEARVTERTFDLEMALSELKTKEQQLQYIAQHDPLTGLANRTLLEDRIAQAIARARRSGRSVAVLMADLDGFKAINDTHGHNVGDQMLKVISARMSECVRETDTVSRPGGDEFVIVLEELLDLADAARVAEKLVEATSWPVNMAQGALRVSISVGLAFFPKDATEPAQLLKRADSTMYAAKTAGRNRWQAASGV
jgi:diguanylate cyclase (GGDEF)-like protein